MGSYDKGIESNTVYFLFDFYLNYLNHDILISEQLFYGTYEYFSFNL